jgi:RNA polymerase sigma-70 factor (ECF subfamily)
MHQIAQSKGPPRSARDGPTRPSAVVVRSAANDESVAAHDVAERALEVAYRTALGVTRDPQLASDIAQDVAIKALHRGRDLRDPDALGAWLHRTAVRTAIDHHRKAQRRRDAETGYASTTSTAHTDEHSDHDLLDLLADLPDRQRAAMTLRHVHDLSDRQIAHALACRTGTARSLLTRATATLRQRLATPPTSKDPR